MIKERGEDCSIEVFGDTWDEQQANAKLIAAAPDLLVALQNALPCLQEYGIGNQLAKAIAAIEKATS